MQEAISGLLACAILLVAMPPHIGLGRIFGFDNGCSILRNTPLRVLGSQICNCGALADEAVP
jgi:hypothetical protein